mmetsp:Transcript_113067/g.324994  ORF Transcript_113067/g.324994 Transcript_113067/m.324994 type:complete len:335 (-) Transcript_113067:633-1637(-)
MDPQWSVAQLLRPPRSLPVPRRSSAKSPSGSTGHARSSPARSRASLCARGATPNRPGTPATPAPQPSRSPGAPNSPGSSTWRAQSRPRRSSDCRCAPEGRSSRLRARRRRRPSRRPTPAMLPAAPTWRGPLGPPPSTVGGVVGATVVSTVASGVVAVGSGASVVDCAPSSPSGPCGVSTSPVVGGTAVDSEVVEVEASVFSGGSVLTGVLWPSPSSSSSSSSGAPVVSPRREISGAAVVLSVASGASVLAWVLWPPPCSCSSSSGACVATPPRVVSGPIVEAGVPSGVDEPLWPGLSVVTCVLWSSPACSSSSPPPPAREPASLLDLVLSPATS